MFTWLNILGIRTSARINTGLAAGMGVVIVIFFAAAARYIFGGAHEGIAFFTRPFYDPATFSTGAVLGGTSIAVLTYIGFDGISTLSEEAENPRRNILLATVLTCVVIGILSAVEVYAAQLVWPASQPFPDETTAFVYAAGRAWRPLLAIVGFTLVVANFGSGMGAQLGAARLLFGMGRSNALPKSFFGAIEPKRRIPRNNVLFVGVFALVGALSILQFGLGAEIVEFRRVDRVHGRQPGGADALLCARARKETGEPDSARDRLPGLPVALAESEPHRADRRRHLDAGRHRFRRLENPRLSRRSGGFLDPGRGGIMKYRIILLSALLSCLYAADSKLPLDSGWYIQPSTDASQDAVSADAPFHPRHSYRATVPSTVMAALVADRVYPDPTFGMNLRTIPGTTYPIGENFSNIPMPPGSPFRSSWWYRTQFTAPAECAGKRIRLHFDGINFRANVWLNGRRISSSDKMAGAWRLFEFDVTGIVVPGKPNALAVEVFPPTPGDLAITFVDWNPAPPDKGMGIWREVYLTSSGPVAIRFPQVITKLDLPAADKAHLTVTAELHNQTAGPVEGLLKGQIENIEFSQPVTLAASETKVVAFAPDKFAQLNLTNPRLWWPAQVGPQNLYGLDLEFETGGAVSDRGETRFGIREVTSELESYTPPRPSGAGHSIRQSRRIFSINGRRILIRGAG